MHTRSVATRLGLVLGVSALATITAFIQGRQLIGRYDLVAVGRKVPGYWSYHGGCDVPTSSFYTFRGARWAILDTIRSSGECKVDLTDSVVARRDSGYYRVAHDTLNLWVDDTLIGVKGWVSRLLIRGDTLVFRAGEFDPGDYVYVRRRR